MQSIKSIFLFFLIGLCVAKADTTPVYHLESYVTDYTSTLTHQQQEQLSELLKRYAEKTTNQVVVLFINTIDGYTLEEYSLQTAQQNGIGQKGKDNGVLVLFVMGERKVRIEVGYGLEGKLTDARSSEIIRNVIVPSFKEQKYYEGTYNGLEAIFESIGDGTKKQLNNVADESYPTEFIMIMLAFGIGLGGYIVLIFIGAGVFFKQSLSHEIVNQHAKTKTKYMNRASGFILFVFVVFTLYGMYIGALKMTADVLIGVGVFSFLVFTFASLLASGLLTLLSWGLLFLTGRKEMIGFLITLGKCKSEDTQINKVIEAVEKDYGRRNSTKLDPYKKILHSIKTAEINKLYAYIDDKHKELMPNFSRYLINIDNIDAEDYFVVVAFAQNPGMPLPKILLYHFKTKNDNIETVDVQEEPNTDTIKQYLIDKNKRGLMGDVSTLYTSYYTSTSNSSSGGSSFSGGGGSFGGGGSSGSW